MTTREAEFSDDDVEQLLEWQRLDREVGPHGFRMSEAMSDDANPANPDGTVSFVARPVHDHAEAARGRAEERYRKDNKTVPAGVSFRVFKEARKPRPK